MTQQPPSKSNKLKVPTKAHTTRLFARWCIQRLARSFSQLVIYYLEKNP